MPSNSLNYWISVRAMTLDEIAEAHTAVGGSARGRRFATQQINRAYAVLLASQFQGFCRDLHTECAVLMSNAVSPAVLQPVLRAEFTHGRQLDKGNAQPGSIGSDFGRLGLELWLAVDAHHADNPTHKRAIIELNEWRNAIVHQTLDPTKLGGTTTLQIKQVRNWRRSCNQLALSIDEVMRSYLTAILGVSPW